MEDVEIHVVSGGNLIATFDIQCAPLVGDTIRLIDNHICKVVGREWRFDDLMANSVVLDIEIEMIK